MKFGAIDIGTNAVRLLIGEVQNEGEHSFVKKISYTRVPLRLGMEVFENGEISKTKTKEFVKTMQAFKLISEVFHVEKLRACATSAMREASNGKEVQNLIADESGVKIEIIPGEEEASLIFSTFSLFNFDKAIPYVVIDVGGGSTEVTVFEQGEIVASQSFQIGTIRMLKGKTSENIWKDIKKWVQENVDVDTHKVFATGGNINSMHKLLGKKRLEPISYRGLKALNSNLKSLTVAQRIDEYQLKEDRADVIVPASDIYLFIMNKLKAKEVYVPKIGLSDGMIYTMYQKKMKRSKN